MKPAAADSYSWSRSRRFTAAIPSRPAWWPRIAMLAPTNRWTIVVDDDIDPTNFNDVIWAMCTRCDPRDQIDIIHGGWSSALDPMCYDTEHDRRNSRVVIDACIPFRRKKTFPVIARSSKALDDRLRTKWAKDLPKRF